MQSETVNRYIPQARRRVGFTSALMSLLQNVYRHRGLMWMLFRRDFFAVYKKSFLGIAWVFAAPFISVVSWVFLQKTGLLRAGELGVPYPIYVLIGTSFWGLFMGFYNSASSTLVSSGGLLIQVRFPHEVMFGKLALDQLSNSAIAFSLNLIVMVGFGVTPAWQTVFIPILIIPLFLLASALGLVVALLNVVAVDISRFVSLGLGLLLYLTPIIYAPDAIAPKIQRIVYVNPMTHLVCPLRDLVLYGRFDDRLLFSICSAGCFLVFVVVWRLFYISEELIVERVG